MSEVTQDIIDLIIANKDKDDNDILGIIIGEGGVAFNKAKGVLNSVLESQGLRMTKAQRDEKAIELMENFVASEDTTPEEVSEQIEMLVDELDCTVGIARGYVRSAFDAEELKMPKAAKATGGPRAPKVPGFRGDVKLAADYAIANPVPTEDDKGDFKAFMDGNGGSTTKSGKDKSSTWYSAVLDLRIFANQWKEAGNCSE